MTVDWPSPPEIPARTRGRTIRTSVSAALAVLVTGAVIATFVLTREPPDRQTPQPAAPSAGKPGPISIVPAAIDIPAGALLQPDEVGPGLVTAASYTAENQPLVDVQRRLLAAQCPAYRSLDLYSGPFRSFRQHVVGHSAKGAGESGGDRALLQSVTRLSPDLARRVVDDARRIFRTCATYTSVGPLEGKDETEEAEARHTWTLVGDGFAGDESMLYRHDITIRDRVTGRAIGDSMMIVLVIRVGDLVTMVYPEGPHGTVDGAVALGRRAAARLCVTANPRC